MLGTRTQMAGATAPCLVAPITTLSERDSGPSPTRITQTSPLRICSPAVPRRHETVTPMRESSVSASARAASSLPVAMSVGSTQTR